MLVSKRNLLKYSQDFTNVVWNNSINGVTSSNNIAPDNTTTAALFTTTGVNLALQYVYAGSITVAPSTTYTLSFYAKLGTLLSAEWLLAIYNETASAMIAVDVATGQTLTTTDWKRVSYTFTTPAGCTSLRVYPLRNQNLGTNVRTFYLWGAQLQLGSTLTSYVPTTDGTQPNLHATGNITWDGNVTLGDAPTDTVNFTAGITSNILPFANNTYNLGENTTPLTWANAYGTLFTATNTNATSLSTTAFTGSGTNNLNGNVIIGTTSANTVTVTARITNKLAPLTTNAYDIGSSVYPWNNIYSVTYNDSNITVTNNTIQTTAANSDLRLVANGVGKVIFSKANVTGNVTIGGALSAIGTGTASTVGAFSPNLLISDFSKLFIGIEDDSLLYINPLSNLTLNNSTTTLANTTVGGVTLTGDYNQTGNLVTTGTITSGSITSSGKLTLPSVILSGTASAVSSAITGINTNTNLVFTPFTGQLVKITSGAKVDQNATVGGTLTVGNTSTLTNTTTGAITLVGDYNQTGNFVTTGTISSGSITAANPLTLPNVTINNSTFTGTVANTDLTLTPKTGFSVDIGGSVGTTTQIDQNLTVGGTLSVSNTSSLRNTIAGVVTLTGDYNQTGNFVTTGTITSGSITSSGKLTLPSVILSGTASAVSSAITGINTNTNLVFTPFTGQLVKITSGAKVDQNATVGGTLTVGNTSTLTNTTTGAITLVGDYNQTGNFVTTGSISSDAITSNGTLTLPTFTVTNSTFTGTTANTNLKLTAYTGKVVEITSNTQVDQSLTVAGTLTVGNTSTLTNTTTGAITLVGDYNQTGNATFGNINSGSIDIGVNMLLGNPNDTLISQYGSLFGGVDDETLLYVNISTTQITNPLTLPTVLFNGSTILGTANGNLRLTSFSGKVVEVASPAKFDGNVSVAGTLGVTKTTTLAATTINGTLTQTGNFNQTGNTNISVVTSPVSKTYDQPTVPASTTIYVYPNTAGISSGMSTDLLSTSVFGGTPTTTYVVSVGYTAGAGYYVILDKPVTVNFGGGNITFTPTGLGTVSANNVILTGLTDTFSLGNFVIGGQTITVNPTGLKTNNYINLLSQTGKLFTGIDDESLMYVNTQGDSMTFLANGTGSVWLGNDLKVNGNTIINNWINYSVPLITETSLDFITETGDSFYSEVNPGTKIQNSIYFTPTGTGSVVINTGRSIVLPSSRDSVSILDTSGEIRFNDVTLNYEGYINPGYVNFINLYSQDQKTYITPELSPGTADKILRFGVNNTVTTTITSNAITNNNLTVNNAVNFTGTTISNTDSSNNINLYSTGNKLTNFNGVNYVKDSTINAPTSGALTFQPTGAGYVQFGGTNGFAIPVGSDSNYPVSPVIGTLRFNSTKVYPEIFNGTIWVPAYGVSSQPSAVEIQDLVLVYELVLGF